MGLARSPSLTLLLAVTLLTLGLSGCLFDDVTKPGRSDWAFEFTGLDTLYKEQGLTGKNVTVAVIDTGIDPDHDEFDHIKLAGWKDFVYGKEKPYDNLGHGSHVAGILVADDALRGGAPKVNLLVAQVFPDDGDGDSSDIADAVRWATNQGADIITMSLGGDRTPILGTETEDAVNEALDKGVFVVAAAGNSQGSDDDNNDDVKSPASVERVIAVGAIDEKKKLAPFSEHGDNDGRFASVPNPPDNDREDPHKKVELVAPGVEIVSAWKDNEYRSAAGTSQATPFVAASLALLLEAKPDLKRNNNDDSNIQRVKDALEQSAEKLPGQDKPHDDGYGYGLVRADKLYEDMVA